MALYRPVQTTFWHDVKVLEEMTPEDKLFYLYLLTNPHTKQIGVYPISKKTMAYEIGYSPESINSLLDRFERHHELIKYNPETRELAIVNWGKYNFPRSGTPIENCVKKELKEVKDIQLIQLIYPHIANEKIKNIYRDFLEGVTEPDEPPSRAPSRDTSRTPSRGEKEKEKQQQKEKEKQQQGALAVVDDETPIQKAIEVIENKFMQLRGKGFPSINDRTAIIRTLDEGIPTKDILYYLEECFRNYTPKHSMDRINSFAYCQQYIMNRYIDKNQAQVRKGGFKRGINQQSDESDFEYIGL